MSNEIFGNAFEYKVIYVFTIEDDTHRGLLKIGDATLHTDKMVDYLTPNCHDLNQAALKRIRSYTNTVGVTPKLLWTELAIRSIREKDGNTKLLAFRDHQIHTVLKNSGIKPKELGKSREWFEIDLETAKKAIDAVKNNYNNLSNSSVIKQLPIILRPEQDECIKKVTKHFKKSDRFLINAKMRYGKTFVSLEIIKRCNFKKTIIVTHRPVVDDGWYEDFTKIFYGSEYIYGSKSKGYSVDELLRKNKPFIYFASVQDLRGSSFVGGKFDKNNSVFKTVWDCMVVDEAHEGTTTALGEDTINAIFKEGSGTKLLALSGTPFNILQNYDSDSIYTWDYIMEQECKYGWDKLHFGDSNPYDELPKMKIYTYNLGDIIKNSKYITFEDRAFNFREFFRTFTGDFSVDLIDMPSGSSIGDFVHEKDVWSFLNLMTRKDKKSHYPYSDEEYRLLFKHTLWMVPGIKEAKALKSLMLKHPVFGSGQFNIVNVAGNGDEEEASEEALTKVRKAIKEADEGYTITLSCGKLTTGVTVKEWTAVFMLAGSYSTSAANYLQTIFRVQSPCNQNGKIKENAYVFDFAPDRTLKMVSSAVSISSKAGKTKNNDKKILGKFLNYCPVIGISGSEMKEYSTTKLLQQLKKAYADKVVRNGFDDINLYNDELFKLQEVDILKFNELKGIIKASGVEKKTRDIELNKQGFSEEEYEEYDKLENKKKKELTPEEENRLEELKKIKKLRKDAISILRGISVRMPLLIYGADIPYEDEITLEKFIDLVDDSSWNEFMPRGVTKEKFKDFKKYYDEDVFIAAGRKIRNMAKEADTLDPTERVKKISSIFNYFKNPDKETVLTPWRVVNMHMSSTLGGWNFWDEDYTEILEKPRFVNNGNVTTETFGNPDVQILEINSKTGLYPLYVTYSCYRTRLESLENKELTLKEKKELWNKVVEKNVYVICKTPMAKKITKRTLLGYDNLKINAHCFDDLINKIKNKSKQFKTEVLRGQFWGKGVKKMKFDAVVGNPPYQKKMEKTSDAPVYYLFMDSAFSLSDKVTLITPGRFLFNAGKTPQQWNKKMLNDPHFKVVYYTPNSLDVFPNVDIKGGVAITFRDSKKNFGKIVFFSKVNEIRNIIIKVLNNNFNSFNELIYSPESYKFSEILHKENPNVENLLSKGHKYDITTNIFDKLENIFKDINYNDNYIGILGRQDGKRLIKYINKEYVKEHPNLDKYKVILPKSNGSGNFGEKLSEPIIVGPSVGHTQTFISIGAFNTQEEAKSVLKYIKTKFARCMLNSLKVTQDNKKNAWANVPNQDFTSSSDINWSKSISEIDKQLYKKYNLSEDEIDFIEKNVKTME